MGVVKLPARRMYCTTETRVDKIANVMTRDRFEEILTTIHFNDNALIPDAKSPNYNKTYKIRPRVDYSCKRFKDVTLSETYQSIDEQVIPFKGKSGLNDNLPKNPHKWGYKLWERAGISGYVYKFEVDGSQGVKGPPAGHKPRPFQKLYKRKLSVISGGLGIVRLVM